MNKLLLTLVLLATILFSCKDDDELPVDVSKDKSFAFEATDGIYHGDLAGKGTAQFTLNLRKGTFGENYSPSGETTVISIKCFSGKASDPAQASLPAGTYTAGSTVNAAAGTYVADATSLTETNASGSKTTTAIGGGNFTVAKTGNLDVITANFTDTDGNKIEGTFSGAITFADESEPEAQDPELELTAIYFGNNLLTFTGGFTLDFHYAEAIDGAAYTIGTQIMAYMDIPTDLDNIKLVAGTYNIGTAGTGEVKTFEPGYFDSTVGVRGTYSYAEELSTSSFIPQKYVTGGTMVVTDKGDGTYHIVVDFTTVAYETGEVSGNISFEYQGEIKFENSGAEYFNLDNITAGYYGDADTPGSANFKSDMFDFISGHRFGLKIDGYINPQSNPTSLYPEEGTYNVADTKAPLTIVKGYQDGTSLSGTYFYYYDEAGLFMDKAVIVTGGTYTIAKSQTVTGGYLVRTNFTGTDPFTGNRVDNVKFEYDGIVVFNNKVPGDPEMYQLNFTKADYIFIERDAKYTNIGLHFYAFEEEYTYTLGIDLYLPPVAEGEDIIIPGTTYEPGIYVPGTYAPGYYNEETNKRYRTGMMKVKNSDKTWEHIVITEGEFILQQIGANYMLMPYLEGTNMATMSPISLRGNFWGTISEKQ